jgi:hypothetical protein
MEIFKEMNDSYLIDVINESGVLLIMVQSGSDSVRGIFRSRHRDGATSETYARGEIVWQLNSVKTRHVSVTTGCITVNICVVSILQWTVTFVLPPPPSGLSSNSLPHFTEKVLCHNLRFLVTVH